MGEMGGQYEEHIAYSQAPEQPVVVGHPAYYPPAEAYGQRNEYPQGSPVYVQNPMPRVQAVGGNGRWSTALCGCCRDCDTCCLTCCCPCVTFGRIAELTDDGASSCLCHGAIYALLLPVGASCIYASWWRGKMRAKYQLPQGCCGDFCTHCACEGCALCQEYRELKHQGLDPSVSWEANLAKARYVQPMTAPTPAGTMVK